MSCFLTADTAPSWPSRMKAAGGDPRRAREHRGIAEPLCSCGQALRRPASDPRLLPPLPPRFWSVTVSRWIDISADADPMTAPHDGCGCTGPSRDLQQRRQVVTTRRSDVAKRARRCLPSPLPSLAFASGSFHAATRGKNPTERVGWAATFAPRHHGAAGTVRRILLRPNVAATSFSSVVYRPQSLEPAGRRPVDRACVLSPGAEGRKKFHFREPAKKRKMKMIGGRTSAVPK